MPSEVAAASWPLALIPVFYSYLNSLLQVLIINVILCCDASLM